MKEGHAQIRAVLTAGGKTYSEGYTLVTREDLASAYYYQPAVQRVSIVDVKIPKDLKVAYIPGAGDEIPTVLQQIGINTTVIPAEKLASENLSDYGTIVLGIRAYDTQKDVAANNKKLLDYVSAGGTLIVQYNASVGDFNSGHFTPFLAAAQPQQSFRGRSSGGNSRTGRRRVSLSQPDHAARLRRMGAGARFVFRRSVGRSISSLCCHLMIRENLPLKGGLLRAQIRQGHIHLHRLRFFPSAAGWRARERFGCT